MRRVARFLRRVITFPWRLSRRRISVQLIYSQVLVVLLTVLLMEALVIGPVIVLFGLGFVNDDQIDYSLGQHAQTAGVLLASDETSTRLAKGAAALTDEDRDELRARLQHLLEQTYVPAKGPYETETIAEDEPSIARALVTDRDGIIAASTDPTWAATGAPVETVDLALTARLTRRVLELDGRPTVFGTQDIIDLQDRTTVASHPILLDGQVAGVVTLQGVQADAPAFADIISLGTLGGFAATNAIVLAVVSIPALFVSIPVGIWRARRISRRLSELADATEAMAAGDLSQRVDVRGEDEIGRVSLRFNDMIARLSETDRVRKAFVANVSHELRTPVAIIQGNLERLLDHPDANPAGERRTLDLIHQETMTLSRLIDDLFTLARIEETTLPLESAPLRVDEVAGQAVEGVRAVAWEQRRVSVESLVSGDLPAVLADRTRLRQVLSNLLYNALRHTPEGGMVVVDARACRDAGMVEVSVSDTGVGIPPEELERVFDRFHRVERSGRHGDGSGLGLHIVRQLVEAQGGTVAVTSEPGRGTTFRFTLPAAESR
jgi:signal transduction histidine kinase